MTIKTYLGFDVGTKRTGIAIANSLTGHANGIDTVIHNKDGSTNWVEIEVIIKQHSPDELTKEVIAEFDKKSHAKMQEFLLQWKYKDDERCINDMIHIRLKMSYLTEFKFIEWKPNP